ncbi:MAG: alanyl-tRNA editing protein [Clostridiales bacterium]|nr:alanyl-tRNA editing protein [Clostridiales bacterium]
MKKTIKLYDIDAYQTDFTAVVVFCRPVSSDSREQQPSEPLYEVILDQTLFFPEEGGQNSDTGTLNGSIVSHVQIKNGIITHITNAPFASGETVTGEIEWETRYSNMQQHSGEHIMSGLIHSHFGYDNVGFHLGSQSVTLDFNGFLDKEQLHMIESLANEAIYRNIEVIAEYPSEKELLKLNYRSKIELNEPVRIVTFPGYDVCACCAPHVRRTGEIGIIKIVDAIRHRGGVRISILCGRRALEDFRMKQEQVYAVSALLSSKPELIAAATERMKEDIFSLKGQIMELQEALIGLKVSQIADGTHNLCLFEEAMEAPVHRKYVNMLVEKCSGVCGVFVGNEQNSYRYIIASKYEDVRTVNERLKHDLHAKGGGCKEMVQGSLTGYQSDIIRCIQS